MYHNLKVFIFRGNGLNFGLYKTLRNLFLTKKILNLTPHKVSRNNSGEEVVFILTLSGKARVKSVNILNLTPQKVHSGE